MDDTKACNYATDFAEQFSVASQWIFQTTGNETAELMIVDGPFLADQILRGMTVGIYDPREARRTPGIPEGGDIVGRAFATKDRVAVLLASRVSYAVAYITTASMMPVGQTDGRTEYMERARWSDIYGRYYSCADKQRAGAACTLGTRGAIYLNASSGERVDVNGASVPAGISRMARAVTAPGSLLITLHELAHAVQEAQAPRFLYGYDTHRLNALFAWFVEGTAAAFTLSYRYLRIFQARGWAGFRPMLSEFLNEKPDLIGQRDWSRPLTEARNEAALLFFAANGGTVNYLRRVWEELEGLRLWEPSVEGGARTRFEADYGAHPYDAIHDAMRDHTWQLLTDDLDKQGRRIPLMGLQAAFVRAVILGGQYQSRVPVPYNKARGCRDDDGRQAPRDDQTSRIARSFGNHHTTSGETSPMTATCRVAYASSSPTRRGLRFTFEGGAKGKLYFVIEAYGSPQGIDGYIGDADTFRIVSERRTVVEFPGAQLSAYPGSNLRPVYLTVVNVDLDDDARPVRWTVNIETF